MSDTKTYVFGNEGNGMLNMLTPLLSLRGLDPNMVFAMMNNKGGQGWENNGMWWIIILFFLLWGRNGWGNEGNNGNGNCGYNSLANLINNDKSADMIMSAIQGNSTAISLLASTLNCDINSIQSTLNSLGGQLCNIGNLIGLTGQQVINSIQLGNMSIVQQLCNCCCEVKQLVSSLGYENLIATLNQTNQLLQSINNVATGLERGFSQLGYATQQLTCDLSNTINNGIQKILDGQCAAEKREMMAIINKQNEDISTYRTAGIISLQLAPLTGALASLRADVDGIKCKLPDTKTIQDPQHYVPVNASVNMPFTLGYSNCGCGYGFNGFTNAF